MAIEYVHETDGGGITVKWLDGAVESEIHVDSAITNLLVQDILDACRAAEDSLQGITYGQIAAASGKETLGVGVQTGITLELLGDWVVYSTKTSGVFRVLGGNLIKGDGSDPFRPNNLITYVNLQSAAATLVTTEGGGGSGGLTPSQEATLNGIEQTVGEIQTELEGVAANAESAANGVSSLSTAIGTLTTAVASLDIEAVAAAVSQLNSYVAAEIRKVLKLQRTTMSDQKVLAERARKDKEKR